MAAHTNGKCCCCTRGITTLYVLALNDGCFYVGVTKNLHRRLLQHGSGQESAAWTRQHAPQSVHFTTAVRSDMDEMKYTLQYMREHGIDKVRGGPWCKLEYTQQERAMIQSLVRSKDNVCYNCGEPGHMASQCHQPGDRIQGNQHRRPNGNTNPTGSPSGPHFPPAASAQGANMGPPLGPPPYPLPAPALPPSAASGPRRGSANRRAPAPVQPPPARRTNPAPENENQPVWEFEEIPPELLLPGTPPSPGTPGTGSTGREEERSLGESCWDSGQLESHFVLKSNLPAGLKEVGGCSRVVNPEGLAENRWQWRREGTSEWGKGARMPILMQRSGEKVGPIIVPTTLAVADPFVSGVNLMGFNFGMPEGLESMEILWRIKVKHKDQRRVCETDLSATVSTSEGGEFHFFDLGPSIASFAEIVEISDYRLICWEEVGEEAVGSATPRWILRSLGSGSLNVK